MRNTFYFALLLSLLLPISACQSPSEKQNELEVMEAQFSEMTGPFLIGHIGTPEGLPVISRNEMPYSVIFAQFADAMAPSEDWMVAAEKILSLKQEIEENEPEIAFHFIEQMAAIFIVGDAAFDSSLVDDSFWTEEKLELLSKQVDVLIKNRNPQSTLIAPALNQLQGYWPEARIREAALMSANATEAWIEQDRKADLPESMTVQNEAFFYRLYTEAAEELRTMANNL